MSSGVNTKTDDRVGRAGQMAARGEALQAEMLLLAVLRDRPTDPHALVLLAQLALQRDDPARATDCLTQVERQLPEDDVARGDIAHLLLVAQAPQLALNCVQTLLRRVPNLPLAWMQLAHIRDTLGDTLGSLKARYQGFSRAHGAGRWRDASSTEPHLRDAIAQASQRYATERRDYLFAALDSARAAHGPESVRRVETALDGYLGFTDVRPSDPRQRPTFLYFPGLGDAPYHDPYLQPWAQRLQDHWSELRREAAVLLEEDTRLRSFLDFPEGAPREQYVSATSAAQAQPAWDAFFFYRHGERYDDNHRRCPATSAVLESIDLCRIDRIAPEICFSFLRPGSRIMPHHGVTNTRLVFHLPLIVPERCALNIVDVGPHEWREGEPMMFDDTYQHEAHNDSGSTRVILLMDCWNPHLSPPERAAVKSLVEAIDELENRP